VRRPFRGQAGDWPETPRPCNSYCHLLGLAVDVRLQSRLLPQEGLMTSMHNLLAPDVAFLEHDYAVIEADSKRFDG
jgi:hypothetical protein